MNNNDMLRRLRYALNITDLKVVELFRLAGYELGAKELESLFKKEEEAGYVECGDARAGEFLEGLVISRRGRKPEAPGKARTSSPSRLSNNDILKRIRIALELREEDVIDLLRLAGAEVSRAEVTALFRKPGQPNFRPCGDQFLRNFLTGLTAKYRV